jgi:recombination protein RecR
VNQAIPEALSDLIDAFAQLPGVGSRTAERYAYYIFKNDQNKAAVLKQALGNIHEQIAVCPKTFALMEPGQDYSPLYTDPKRDKTIVAVVAEPFDIVALEKTNSFKGTYHVLGGLLSPIDNVGPEQLKINELVKRIDEDGVKEIIMATNASVEGESTALLLSQQIGERPVKITRLARGIPVGVDLEYADLITLTRALEGRQALL